MTLESLQFVDMSKNYREPTPGTCTSGLYGYIYGDI